MLQNEIGSKRWPAYSHPVKEEKRAYRLTEVFSATAYQIKAITMLEWKSAWTRWSAKGINAIINIRWIVCTDMQIGGQTARQFVSWTLTGR